MFERNVLPPTDTRRAMLPRIAGKLRRLIEEAREAARVADEQRPLRRATAEPAAG